MRSASRAAAGPTATELVRQCFGGARLAEVELDHFARPRPARRRTPGPAEDRVDQVQAERAAQPPVLRPPLPLLAQLDPPAGEVEHDGHRPAQLLLVLALGRTRQHVAEVT